MRKLRCKEVQGTSVGELLDEFNERAEEFGITSEDEIVSVSVMPPAYPGVKVHDGTTVRDPRVMVVIVYWSNE